MESVQHYLTQFFEVPAQWVREVDPYFERTSLKKNDFLLQTDSYGAPLCILLSGYVRIFDYVDGKDITQWISSPGELVTDLGSLLFDIPVRRNVQAIVDCTMFSISKTNYHKLKQDIPAWSEIEYRFLGKCFLMLEDRVFSFLSLPAEDRLRKLMDHNPELFHAVPLRFIASMLGMTPETLSRLRRP